MFNENWMTFLKIRCTFFLIAILKVKRYLGHQDSRVWKTVSTVLKGWKNKLTSFLQVNNSRNIISSHYVQRSNRRGNEIVHIRGKTCFFFGHRSYTDLRDKLYHVSGLYLALL